jgi:hypothetical protein
VDGRAGQGELVRGDGNTAGFVIADEAVDALGDHPVRVGPSTGRVEPPADPGDSG